MKLDLDQPVAELKGVGDKVAQKLAKLEVATVGDLIRHYPRRYDDFSQVTPINKLQPGPVSIRAQVLSVSSRRAMRRPLTITEAIFTDGTGTLKAIWFNQPYIKRNLVEGTEVLVSGKLEFRNNDLALQAPAVEMVDRTPKSTARIVPVYPETASLSSNQLRGLILPLIEDIKELPETLPPYLLKKAELMSRGEALAEIHFPTSTQQLVQAKRLIAFEELFLLILTGLIIKQEIKTEPAPVINFKPEVAKEFTEHLEFVLTDAQRQAAWQILQDMDKDQPMNRLLQGDVGSGKTVVATMAAVMALANGFQAAIMVPTDILARQHATKLTPLLEKLGYRVQLVLGKQTAAEKRAALERVASGEAQFVLGTHALVSEKSEFKNLGLVVIDEQHRFGVNQRLTLKQKAGRLPHLLSMTATPIPRSLALTVYGDLDISIIDTLPPGRQPVQTRAVNPADRDQAYQVIDKEIEAGRQVFVVCPLIEESDKLGAKSVTAELERLQKTVFKHRDLAALHGRMNSDEKQMIMQRFAAGKIDILISTSVIEVGIDVPNATVMMIEGADRFGLAALHQLRGRVGRGRHQSYCFLLSDVWIEPVKQRLQALERTSDGFRLAQIDLENRGPGEIYGLRQHGLLDLKMADLSDTKLLAVARQAAQDFLGDQQQLLKYPQIVERINELKSVTSLD